MSNKTKRTKMRSVGRSIVERLNALPSLIKETNKLIKSELDINLLLIIRSNVTGETYKFLYTELGKYPFIKFKLQDPYSGLIRTGKDRYRWPKIVEWEELSLNLNKKLEQLFSKGALVLIPNPIKKDLYDVLETSSYKLEGLKNLDIPERYDSIFKGSPFKFIIVPGNLLQNTKDELFKNRDNFKNKLFVVANVYLKGKEITKKEFEKKKKQKNIEMQKEKIEMGKMSEHEKNIYRIMKKTKKGVTSTCQYHIEELKNILSGFRGPTKFEIRRDKLKAENLFRYNEKRNKKVLNKEITRKAILQSQKIKKRLQTFFREYKEASKLSQGKLQNSPIIKAIKEINEINPASNNMYTGTNLDILLYQYYRTYINELNKEINSMEDAKKERKSMAILKFADGKLVFNDFYQPDYEDIRNIKNAVKYFKSVLPNNPMQGGRRTRKKYRR